VKGRTAILGGTFNPVHIGHLRLALEVAECLDLACVELMPCASAPHKANDDILPYSIRVELLQSAIAHEPRLAVSTIEESLPCPSYTWNTIQAWTKLRGEVPLFIMGDDDFASLDTWYRGIELPSILDIIVVPRNGNADDFIASLDRLWHKKNIIKDDDIPNSLRADMDNGRTCIFLPVPHIELSATALRQRFLLGKSLRWLMPNEEITALYRNEAVVRSTWKNIPSQPMLKGLDERTIYS